MLIDIQYLVAMGAFAIAGWVFMTQIWQKREDARMRDFEARITAAAAAVDRPSSSPKSPSSKDAVDAGASLAVQAGSRREIWGVALCAVSLVAVAVISTIKSSGVAAASEPNESRSPDVSVQPSGRGDTQAELTADGRRQQMARVGVHVPPGATLADIERVEHQYTKGSTMPREHQLEPLRATLRREFARNPNAWDLINDLKLQMLRISVSSHPEIGDINFRVARLEEDFHLAGSRSVDTTQTYHLVADNDWRSLARAREFNTRHLLGIPRRTPGVIRSVLTISAGATRESMKVLDPTDWQVVAFNSESAPDDEARSSEFVVTVFVPRELLEAGKGEAFVSIRINDQEKAGAAAASSDAMPPISVYSYECQRFYRDMEELSVTVWSGISKKERPDGLDSDSLWAVSCPFLEDSEPRVPVKQSYENAQWVYRFFQRRPSSAVAFVFRK